MGCKPEAAVDAARVEFTGWYERAEEFAHFRRVLGDEFARLAEGELISTGYLGGDTDTTGCVAGGLAGVHYGLNAIPEKWIQALARHADVEALLNNFSTLIENES